MKHILIMIAGAAFAVASAHSTPVPSTATVPASVPAAKAQEAQPALEISVRTAWEETVSEMPRKAATCLPQGAQCSYSASTCCPGLTCTIISESKRAVCSPKK